MKAITLQLRSYGLQIVVVVSLACQTASGLPAASSTPEASPLPPSTATPPPAIPPAEGWIAFGHKNNIWLIHPDGSGLLQLTDNPVPQKSEDYFTHVTMRWSPDGSSLAFAQGSALYVVDVSTFLTRLLVDDTGGGFDWASSGHEVLYSTPPKPHPDIWDDHGLWMVDTETGETAQAVPSTQEHGGFMDPDLSHDGRHVLYAVPAFEPAGYGLITLDTGSWSPVPVLSMGGMGMGDCQWSPVELQLVCFTVTDDFPYESVLRLVGPSGERLKELLLPEGISIQSTLRWSPDGTRIGVGQTVGFFDSGDMHDETTLFTLSSEEFRALGNGRISDWSPDGQWILMHNPSWAGARVVFPITLLNVDTGQSYPVTDGMSPVWQPRATQAAQLPQAIERLCTAANITFVDTPKGNYLQMCAQGAMVEVGPLESGGYALGPNGHFFVYCANSGSCFAARKGETRLTPIGTVKHFSIIRRGEAPEYSFYWRSYDPYTVEVYEGIMEQSEVFSIPRRITADE